MYDWHHSEQSEEALKEYLAREMNVEYKGVGLYLTDTDTLLITVDDSKGERATPAMNISGILPKGEITAAGQGACWHVYVFNRNFDKTIFAYPVQTISDLRTK